MKLLICSLLLWCGCSRIERNVTAASNGSGSEVIPDQDRIVLPPGSPKLERIRVEPVKAEPVPVDEVLVPGNVEANPNRISHVVMPASGRVRQVLVGLGDAVSEGQPLLTIDSPDARGKWDETG